MNDVDKTNLLTKLGYLVLRNMGCKEISTEVTIPTWLLPHLDNQTLGSEEVTLNSHHYVIDVLGVEREYLPPSKQFLREERKVRSRLILRGIEIKVSRNDFKRGFIHVGCHFNYLMVPKDLVTKSEVHRDIGVIEVDLDNYQVRKLNNSECTLIGVELVRTPKRKALSEMVVERCREQISNTLTNQTKRWLIESFSVNNHARRFAHQEM